MALTNKLTAIGDAIREKTGKSALLSLDEMPVEIRAIETGGGSGGDNHEWEDGYLSTTTATYDKVYYNDRITTIRSYAFAGTRYSTINLPNVAGFETGDISALFKESGIGGQKVNIILPKLDKMPNSSFEGSKMTELIIEAPMLTSLGLTCFSNCNQLTNITLPDSIEVINDYCFQNCYKLQSIDLPNVKTVKGYAFQSCNMLTNVNLPNLTTLGGNNHFYYCQALTEIKLPSLTTMGTSVFAYCPKIKKVDLGESFTAFPSITGSYYGPFYSCPMFDTLILRSNTLVINPSSYLIDSSNLIAKGTGYIYVPAALIEDYKVAANWAPYAAQFRAIEDYPDICGEA